MRVGAHPDDSGPSGADTRRVPLPPTVYLKAVTHAPRHGLTSLLVAAVDRWCDLLDVRRFSNMALALRFELRRDRAGQLVGALDALPLELSSASRDALDTLDGDDAGDDVVTAALHVTFLRPEPTDLRIRVPAVPG